MVSTSSGFPGFGPPTSAPCTPSGAIDSSALTYYRRALPITRDVGDRAGEAATRYNIATIHRADGNLDRVIGEPELVVDLDHQVSHPNLASDTAELARVRQERTQTGNAT